MFSENIFQLASIVLGIPFINSFTSVITRLFVFSPHKLKVIKIISKADISSLKVIARKTLMSEVKKSKAHGKYGFVHRDIDDKQEQLIAGMLYFDQSFDGGTAFFENHWDKTPDIYVSAYPDRLILYHGHRWHAPAFDYTFEERKTLSFFATIGNKNG